MSKYLKNFLFALIILVMPYMNSASKAMDEENYGGSTARTHNVSFVEKEPQDILSHPTPTIPSTVLSLVDTKVSWASYLISPVKSNIRKAYDVVNYVVQNPKKGMIISMILASNFITVAAGYDCMCALEPSGAAPYFRVRMHPWDGQNVSLEKCGMNCDSWCKSYTTSFEGPPTIPLYIVASYCTRAS